MSEPHRVLQGAGLGLRRALLGPLLTMDQGEIDFIEAAPENWIGVGGRSGKKIACHGGAIPIGTARAFA
jgi:hypothetical protein